MFHRHFQDTASFTFYSSINQCDLSNVDFIIQGDDGDIFELEQFKSLKAIASPYPYVDHILRHYEDLSEIPTVRVRHKDLTNSAADYVHMRILYINLHMHHYRLYQKSALWKQHQSGYIQRIGILGLGDVGKAIADRAQNHGFDICCWRREKTESDHEFPTFTGHDGLIALLKSCNFIVNCLPLTQHTINLIDHKKFHKMPVGTCIVNIGRGGVVVEKDLLEALNSGRLAHAYMDTFTEEPLPKDSPFWSHPQVHLTPHIAIPHIPKLAAQCTARNIEQILNGETPYGLVDQRLQY